VNSRSPNNGMPNELTGVFQGWNDIRMCAWLLKGFSSGDFAPLEMLPEPSVALQIHHIFCASDPSVQATIKSGVARAILEWSPSAFDYAVLSELARTAAHVRASESVSPLGKHIQSAAFRRPRNDASQEACDTVVAVLKGFEPLEELHAVLLNLYASEEFREYGAQVFLSLCSYSPRRFCDHLGRFLEIVHKECDKLRLDLIVDDFVRIVPQQYIEAALTTLFTPSLQEFVQILVTYSPLAIGSGLSFQDADSVDSSGADETFAVNFAPVRDGTVACIGAVEQRQLFHSFHQGVTHVGLPNMLEGLVRHLDQRGHQLDEFPY
jgi:hypothetical protein